MRVAFLFPGQGSQTVGMMRDFMDHSPGVRALYGRAGDVLGFDLAGLTVEGPAEDLNRTVNTQPALLVAALSVFHELREQGVRPVAGAGHSLGEISALAAAGAIGFEDAVTLARARGEYMQQAVPLGEGAMAAVLGLEWGVVAEVCGEIPDGDVWPANDNAPGQVVIAGRTAAVESAVERLKDRGARRVVPLTVSGPFHCPLMQPASERLARHLLNVEIGDAAWPVYDNASTEPLRGAAEIRPALVRQVSEPLRWVDSLRRMASDGVDTFVEVGPGRVLQGLVKKILPEAALFGVGDPEALADVCDKLVKAAPAG